MTEPPFDEEPDFNVPIEPVQPSRARPWLAVISIVLIFAIIITGLAGFGLPMIWHPSTEITITVSSPGPTTATIEGQRTTELAVIDDSGSLLTMDAVGGSVVRHDLPDVKFTFPAWSPDGSQIAVTGTGPDGSGVYVVPVETAVSPGEGGSSSSAPSTPASPGPPQPVAVYLSRERPAFYVYWTPNSRSVGFLSSDPTGAIQLRLAPADASADAGLVRQGSPMYWVWVDDARLLVHAGGGSGAFLGEVAPDGQAASGTSDPVDGAGEFRAPAISSDGRFRAYAGRGSDRAAAVIVEPRGEAQGAANPAARTEVKVLGPAALEFDPAGDRLAFVARAAADAPETDLPVGPLKVVDAASGTVRTVLPGSVLGFFWSPDGGSIAALRLISSGAPATAAVARPGAAPAGRSAEAAANAPRRFVEALYTDSGTEAATGFDLQLTFVDPADGTVRSQRSVRLSDVFTTQVLPYFDQYALSHRIWSSDGASIALPVVAPDLSSEIRLFRADGSADTRIADGVAAFWRP